MQLLGFILLKFILLNDRNIAYQLAGLSYNYLTTINMLVPSKF